MSDTHISRVIAGIMAVGVVIFTLGVGIAMVSQSEVDELLQSGRTELASDLKSLDDRTVTGILLASAGAGMTVFTLLIDEGRREREKEKNRGFFH